MIGKAAKRPLRAGSVVLAHDYGSAVVIKSGDLVTVTYDADGVSLTLQGKAMASAGVGETLAVQNTQSKKIVQAVVSGPGQAVVGPAADRLKPPSRTSATPPVRGSPPCVPASPSPLAVLILPPLAPALLVEEAVKGPGASPVGFPAQLAPLDQKICAPNPCRRRPPPTRCGARARAPSSTTSGRVSPATS